MKVRFRVNGVDREVGVDASTRLLYVLRNDFGLSGPKFGCGLGQCGACTVLIDGRPVRSCQRRMSAVVEGAEVVTLEGLGSAAAPHPLQQAFIDEQALQCGYCTAGLVVAAVALLRENPQPTETEIREALAGHLCRCGVHGRVVRAVQRAAGEIRR